MGMDTQGQFQLRRTGPAATCPNVKDIMILPLGVSKFGRAASNTYYLDSLSLKNFISRNHAEIHGIQNENGQLEYILYDKGLNGTFINDIKMNKTAVLEEGDKITFGHTNGYKLSAGEYSQQPNSEFQFVFERVPGTSSIGKQSEDGYESDMIARSSPPDTTNHTVIDCTVSNSRTKKLVKSNSSSSLSSSCSSSSNSSSSNNSSSSSSSESSASNHSSKKYSETKGNRSEDRNSDNEDNLDATAVSGDEHKDFDDEDEEEDEEDEDYHGNNDDARMKSDNSVNDSDSGNDEKMDDSEVEKEEESPKDLSHSDSEDSDNQDNHRTRNKKTPARSKKKTRTVKKEVKSENPISPEIPVHQKQNSRSKLKMPIKTKTKKVNNNSTYSDDEDLPSLNGNQGAFTSEDRVELSRDPYAFTSGPESDDETSSRLKAVINSISQIASPQSKGKRKTKGRTKIGKGKQRKNIKKEIKTELQNYEDEDDDDEEDVLRIVEKPQQKQTAGRKRKASTKPVTNRKSKKLKPKPQKPRNQRKKNTKLRKEDEDDDDDDDDEEEEEDLEEGVVWYNKETCDSSDCKRPSSKKVQWVQCDYCDKWYHTVCMNCKYEHVNDPDIKFSCGCT